MARAGRDGPQQSDFLPAEYRSGPFLSEAQSVMVPAVPPPPPPRRLLGLRARLVLWVLLTGLCLSTLVVAIFHQQRLRDADEELRRAALLCREIILSQPAGAGSCAAFADRTRPGFLALGDRTGYGMVLYSGERILLSTFSPGSAPQLPPFLAAPILERSTPLLRPLSIEGRRHLAAFVGLSSTGSAPGPCRPLLLALFLPAPSPLDGPQRSLFALLFLFGLLPSALLLPVRLHRLLSRLHDRVAALSPRAASVFDSSAPHNLPPPRLPDLARLTPLDEELLERGDELGDLARAFASLIDAMRENEARLGARVRELTTLHAIGRAISSVLDLEEALRKIVSEVVAVFAARRGALVLAGPGMRYYLGAGVRIAPGAAQAVAALGEVLVRRGGRVRIDDLGKDPELAAAARHGGLSGSLMAVPLDQQGSVLGIIMITRSRGRQRFTDSDLQLLATVADQASTAISNARLYDEVQRSSEDLELRVKERTLDLVMANQELARVVENLRQAQAQLLLSERLAGLGQLVAGVAHEINSPAAAIRGAADSLSENVGRMGERARQLAELPLPEAVRAWFHKVCDDIAPTLHAGALPSPTQVRRRARDWAAELGDLLSGPGEATELLDTCRTAAGLDLSERTMRELADGVLSMSGPAIQPVKALSVMVGYLEQRAYLHRNAHAIRAAIGQITRIVGALKSYSHLDQARVVLTDVHEGLETTLVILHSELKYGILLTRKYGKVPAIHAYVDELNQVWTNLLHNAVQALNERETATAHKEITIESGHVTALPPSPARSFGALSVRPATLGEGLRHIGELPGLRLTGPLRLVAHDDLPGDGPADAGDPEGLLADDRRKDPPEDKKDDAPGNGGESSDGGYVWVAIEDNGPGIQTDVLPRIFEPFFTTKQKGEGTGLGLGIAQGIVSKHGGRIDVASTPGKTRFIVWLPVKGPAAAQS